MGYYHYNMMGPWGSQNLLGGIGMIIFWILIIIGIVLFVKLITGSDGKWHKDIDGIMHNKSSALDILKERYAKGEIDKKEFEEKKKDISE